MSVDAPTSRELDAIRDQGDRFIAELNEEFYLHYAGLKDTLDVEQVYERYEELTRLDTAQRLEGAPTELWRFACEGFLGNLTRAHQQRAAAVEASLETTADGEKIPYRMIRVVIANEPDRDRRRRLEQERVRLLDEHLNPVYLEAFAIDRDAVGDLGSPNYYELYKRFGFRLDELAEQCREVLDETERIWETEADRHLPRASRHPSRRRRPVGRRTPVPRPGARPDLPQRRDAARARGDARRPRHRPALAGECPPRRRRPPEQVAARVLRARSRYRRR